MAAILCSATRGVCNLKMGPCALFSDYGSIEKLRAAELRFSRTRECPSRPVGRVAKHGGAISDEGKTLDY